MAKKKVSGFVLGKFMPPHKGHAFLFDFAKEYCDELYILVCSLDSEPIPGKLRYNWVKESWPECNVIHLNKDMPQEPNEHPDFWNIWKNEITQTIPEKIDIVFASEKYGNRLAKELGAKFIPVDLQREAVEISGTSVRENTRQNFHQIIPAAKPYYQRTVCIVGPESTGKSILTKKLAQKFNGVNVQEYARQFIDNQNQQFTESDLTIFAKAQNCAISAAKKSNKQFIFSDTDAIITQIYHEIYYKSSSKKVKDTIRNEIANQEIDLYLVLKPNVPWVDDGQRDLPHKRDEFYKTLIRKLKEQKQNYHIIDSETYESRFKDACKYVEASI